MTIPEGFLQPLILLHARLSALDLPWAFTGSLGMVLQGMDLEIHDIDLQTTAHGVPAIQQALADFVTRPAYFRASERIRSHFAVFAIAGVQVEVMGDMQHVLEDGAWSAPPELGGLIRWVTFHGMRLPVMDLHHEVEAYRQMGRQEKAERIRKFLELRQE